MPPFSPSLPEETAEKTERKKNRKKHTTHTQLTCQRVTLLLCPDFAHFQLFPPTRQLAVNGTSLRLDTAPTLHLDSRTQHGERENSNACTDARWRNVDTRGQTSSAHHCGNISQELPIEPGLVQLIYKSSACDYHKDPAGWFFFVFFFFKSRTGFFSSYVNRLYVTTRCRF